MRLRALRWPFYYYASTLGFMALDALTGANLRAVAFEAYPGIKSGYYVLLLGCAGLIRLQPKLAAPITLVESSVTVTVLCMAVLAPYYGLALGQGSDAGIDMRSLVFNFLLAGSVAVISFHQAIAALPGARRRSLNRF